MIVKKEGDINYYDSSNILFSTYDNIKRKLYICFKYGQTYVYEGISPEINEFFENATSQGKFLNENIKPVFNFKKDVLLGEFETKGVESFIRSSLKEKEKKK